MKPKTATKTLIEILGDYVPNPAGDGNLFSIKIYDTVSDSNGNYPVLYSFSANQVISKMIEMYGLWSFVYINVETNFTDPVNPTAVFFASWTDYKEDNMTNWQRIAHAYNVQYNPIFNYDRTESETTENSHNNTLTDTYDNYKVSSDIQPKQITTVTKGVDGNESATITGKTTYDRDVFTDAVKSVETGKDMTETYYDTEKTTLDTTYSGGKTESSTGNDNITRKLNVSGNIGVTSTQSMITQEMQLRRFEMLDYIIVNFVRKYLVLIPSECD